MFRRKSSSTSSWRNPHDGIFKGVVEKPVSTSSTLKEDFWTSESDSFVDDSVDFYPQETPSLVGPVFRAKWRRRSKTASVRGEDPLVRKRNDASPPDSPRTTVTMLDTFWDHAELEQEELEEEYGNETGASAKPEPSRATKKTVTKTRLSTLFRSLLSGK